jgi:hypothetical protein
MLTPSLAPTLPQQSCQLSHPIIDQQPLSEEDILFIGACKTGYPNRSDGRNWGIQIASVSDLHQFWKGRANLWQITVLEGCATLTAPGLILKFNENSSLSLVYWLNGPGTTARHLPKSLALGVVCEFLGKSLEEPFFFVCGDNYDPPPLAEIDSPLRVDIIMQGRDPTALFPDFLHYLNIVGRNHR